MKRKLLFTLFTLIMIGALSAPFFWDDVLRRFWPALKSLPQIERLAADLKEINRNISSPPPLRLERENVSSYLTLSGIIEKTNQQRQVAGLTDLTTSPELAAAAAAKASDMFARRFFAHVAPDGTDASALAEQAGYDYISIGENLALGNFTDDADLVQAWMDSPGHRANILDGRYSQIGVAAKKGIFEGKSVWMAVQIFGRPMSACQHPDLALKVKIDQEAQALESSQQALEDEYQAVEAMEPKRGKDYDQKVNEYNEHVEEYNSRIKAMKEMIRQYNGQVDTFNVCLGT